MMRSHGRQSFLYDDGAFGLVGGVVPGYVISRCQEYAGRVECGMWRTGKHGEISRASEGIPPALGRSYLSISRCVAPRGATSRYPT